MSSNLFHVVSTVEPNSLFHELDALVSRVIVFQNHTEIRPLG